MRKLLLVVVGVALGVVLALPGAATASHDPTGAPFDEDFAVGDASFRFDVRIDLDAHSGPGGENPRGLAFISQRLNFLGGPVTCLKVAGNRAVIGGQHLEGGGYLFEVEDNAAGGVPDRFGSSGTAEPPTTCPAELPIALEPITSGDLVVHDAQPFPTSKDQCKNGGWRNFGSTFRNQGQCVAFVERHPQP